VAKKNTSKSDASKKASPKKAPRKRVGRGVPWTFPKVLLEEAIAVPKAVEEKFAGHPAPIQEIAKAVGFRQANDWRFKDLLRSANQYGLVFASGASKIILDAIGEFIVAPSSPDERKKALRDAFRCVSEFAKVEDYYGGKKLPDDEYFLNTLVREFQIDRERVDVFAKIFRENTKFLRSFDVDPRSDELIKKDTIEEKKSRPVSEAAPRTREFLETCFVMMPFGKWFDLYYKEIYIPAIRDAGFEPKRADELFSTGSVVEQIWEEIEKSSVLLADLTDKNPNVFYELGLAHAACKPVVFTSAQVDDVPFDLRHLRVIIYEIREPRWADKLQSDITEYLKNTREEPEKSIPQPFRDRYLNRGEEEEEELVVEIEE